MTAPAAFNVWVALFRGINVGGKHILPMKDLRALLTDMGLLDVQTYIQSGNAVFRQAADNTQAPSSLAEQITSAVSRQYEFEPKVLIVSKDALQEVISANPFPEAAQAPKTLYLYFLAGIPEQPDWAKLEALKQPSEHMKLVENVFYLYAPDGIGRSKLAAKAEKLLGIAATARNWRTVCKLAELASSIAV
ncbi:MAG: DUF1697 domain-containing protein [Deinococcota bacterium]